MMGMEKVGEDVPFFDVVVVVVVEVWMFGKRTLTTGE